MDVAKSISKYKRYMSAVFVIVGSIALVVVIYFQNNVLNIENRVAGNDSTLSGSAYLKAKISEKSKIKLPEIIKETPIDNEDIPSDLKVFMLSDNNPVAFDVEYVGGRMGYKLNVSLNIPFDIAFTKYIKDVGDAKIWKPVTMQKSKNLAIMEYESPYYMTVISLNGEGESLSSATIKMMKPY